MIKLIAELGLFAVLQGAATPSFHGRLLTGGGSFLAPIAGTPHR
jgi:hypothetical protein